MPRGLGGGGRCLLQCHVPSYLGVGLEAACDHPFPTSFWKRLSRLMSKVNPEPNVIHVMGCYVLGNPNGEKVQHPTSCRLPFCLSPPREIPVPGLTSWDFLLTQPRFCPPLSCSALHSRVHSLLSALPEPQDPHDSLQGNLRVAPGAVGSR